MKFLTRLYRRIRRSLVLNSLLHYLAMNAPHGKLRIPLYRMRGIKIGKNVAIGPGVFIEEARPELITIDDNVSIAPNVTIVSHDSSYNGINPHIPVRREKVILKRNSYIGAGSTILPGITIGEYSIIGAGSVVVNDIPPRSVAVGAPARVIKSVDEKDEHFTKNSG